jgi:osmotically-inducible protein OsmY
MSEGVEMRIDSDIKRDVEDELQWDPDIDATDIGVTVKSGVVTLTGFVHSYSHKLQAEEDAKRVTGVSGVANDIEVRLPSADVRPDPEIARDVVSELRLQLPFSWEKLKAVVKNGWVTLEGEAEWNYRRERAEQAVRHVKGVIGVSNLIKLKPSVAAADIKRKIEEAFKRNAEIDANRIQVRTSGSEVILEGTVRSWAERQEAERVAWSAPGVAKVEDRIIISP